MQNIPDRRIRHELASTGRLLQQADSIFLQRRWTESEVRRALKHDEERLKDAAEHSDTYGIAEYLAAGPRLYQEWQMGWEVGVNPRGAALIDSAVGCTLTGLPNAIPEELLRRAHQIYLDRSGGDILRPEPFAAALSWATRRRYGVSSLLLPTKEPNTYRVFDYILDVSVRSEHRPKIPKALWTEVVNYYSGRGTELHRVARAAWAEGEHALAEGVLQSLAEAGDGHASHNLGHIFDRREDEEEALKWWKHGAEYGDMASAGHVGQIFADRHNFAEAAKWYEVVADSGNAAAMAELAYVLYKLNRPQQANEWLAKAAGRRSEVTESTFGNLLRLAGRTEEAEASLRQAASSGDPAALNALGIVLSDQGKYSEAEDALRRAARLESGAAMANLGQLLEKRDEREEADDLYKKAIVSGIQEAYVDLQRNLCELGRTDEARRLLQDVAEDGNLFAAYGLGLLLAKTDQHKEAEKWLRQAADADLHEAKGSLALTLKNLGKSEEAVKYWIEASSVGDGKAGYLLGMWHKEEGDLAKALGAFLEGATNGDVVAACELGHLLADSQEAERWLQISIDGGHGHAACTLGQWRLTEGRTAEAERLWRLAYATDHAEPHVALSLSRLLAQNGNGKEAAVWLRKAKNGGRSLPSRRKSPRKKRRK